MTVSLNYDAPSASVKFHLRTVTLGAKDNGEIPGAAGYWLDDLGQVT